MFNTLYVKLIASGLILAAIGLGYWYVKNLQHYNSNLQKENATLSLTIDQLKQQAIEQQRTQTIIEKVVQQGDAIKQKSAEKHRKELKSVDDKVTSGEDKPVGKLLRDWLNEQ